MDFYLMVSASTYLIAVMTMVPGLRSFEIKNAS